MGRAHEVRAASMAKTAAAKSKLYSIYAKEIYQVAKNGGANPEANPALKRLIEKAKKEQVPSDVINRSIDKVNKGITEDYTVCEYEAFGPGGSNLIIKCLTDNVNRTVASIKTVANKTAAKIAGQGAVSFMYEHLCVVGIKGHSEEEVMDVLFNADIDVKDMEMDNDILLIYASPSDLSNMKKALEDAYQGINFEIDEIGKYAKDMVTLEGEDLIAFNKILTMLDDVDDVSNVYHNVNL
jgi:YebC/PmpR family DNA-binding regulatory protein